MSITYTQTTIFFLTGEGETESSPQTVVDAQEKSDITREEVPGGREVHPTPTTQSNGGMIES